jgi:glutamate--cysteine ligase
MRFIDIFLLHCLLQTSPPDTPGEIAALGRNQLLTAARGREPGLTLERGGAAVPLVDWAAELLEQCAPIAAALNAGHGTTAYTDTLAAARAALARPDTLPSARVLSTMQRDFGGSYTAFIRAQGDQTRNHLLALPWTAEQQMEFEAMARASQQQRAAIEAADTVDFETFRQAYLAPERLTVSPAARAALRT